MRNGEKGGEESRPADGASKDQKFRGKGRRINCVDAAVGSKTFPPIPQTLTSVRRNFLTIIFLCPLLHSQENVRQTPRSLSFPEANGADGFASCSLS